MNILLLWKRPQGQGNIYWIVSWPKFKLHFLSMTYVHTMFDHFHMVLSTSTQGQGNTLYPISLIDSGSVAVIYVCFWHLVLCWLESFSMAGLGSDWEPFICRKNGCDNRSIFTFLVVGVIATELTDCLLSCCLLLSVQWCCPFIQQHMENWVLVFLGELWGNSGTEICTLI